MYRKGHYGIALLVFAPIGLGLVAVGAPTLALLTAGAMLGLVMLPDVDHRLPLVEHRGATHSLLFAGLVGGVFAGVGYLAGDTVLLSELLTVEEPSSGIDPSVQFAAVGFAIGSLTVITHLIGDALTPSGVSFLWPLSGKRYSLGVARADSTLWNYGLFALGITVFAATAYLAAGVAGG